MTFPGQTSATLFSSLPLASPFVATVTEVAPTATTPEPGSLLLAGAGLPAVAGMISRRRSN